MLGIFHQGGAWYTYVNTDGELSDLKLNGKYAIVNHLKDNEELYGEIQLRIKDMQENEGIGILEEMTEEEISLAKDDNNVKKSDVQKDIEGS